MLDQILFILSIAGVDVPLREKHANGNGNVYAALVGRNNDGSFSKKAGVSVPAVTENLPTTATLYRANGNERGEQVMTFALYGGKTQSGNAKTSGKSDAHENLLPGDSDAVADVLVSQPASDRWFVQASVHRPGGGGGSKLVENTSDLF